ncbi:enoyl-CoA hydratase [Mesorhizobium sp. CAU 1732]|uniref:enoyl-CoA hydratase n=1 Tax=Mesorhizobium sp. CAU 1732 TaxID=3140358 RepID=UPI0032603731
MIEKHFSAEDGVLQITINRPEKKNAITFEMYEALIGALRDAAERTDVFVVVIAGKQAAFTVGNDLANFAEWPEDDKATAAWRFLEALSTHPKPVIAAVDGLAIGIGTTMLLHCDLAYATPNARFQLPFVSLGLVPEAASSILLPLLVGRKIAGNLLFTGEPFTAEEAFSFGLLNDIYSVEDFLPQVMKKAKQIADKPATAIQATKRLMTYGLSDTVNRQMELEQTSFNHLLKGPDFAEAFSAFRERRKPNFRHSSESANLEPNQ